jgi:hypothetical protein
MAAKTCSEPACERPTTGGGRGLCPNHYQQRRRWGTLPPKTVRGPDMPCAAPGCEEKTGRHGAQGLCPKHYQRLTKSDWGLEQPTRTASLNERFYAKVSKSPCPCGCECELWTAGIHPKTGYGHFSIDDKTYLAHRIAYEIEVGPIPDGMVIDHVYENGCRHRHCVKRAHLEPVTDTVNNQRIPITPIVSERRAAAGRKGAAARWALHPYWLPVEQPEQ